MSKVTIDDVELMREYVSLLEQAKELREYAPTDEEMADAAQYVSDLKEADELSAV